MTDPRASFETRNVYIDACERGAMFDARCFNIPKEEAKFLGCSVYCCKECLQKEWMAT